MKGSPWRRASAETIDQLLTEGRAAGLDGRALERYVSKGYPFGERTCYPYRVWLHEFDMRVRGRDRTFRGTPRRHKRRSARTLPGQLLLFDVT